jgi:hypothetical protein
MSVAAASPFWGPIIPEECKCARVEVEGTASTSPSAPSYGCVLRVVQNGITVLVGVSVIVIVLAIAYAGFVFMTAGANPHARQQGRNVVFNSVIGLVIILGAWLGVDFIMKAVYNPEAVYSGNLKLGPWNAIWAPGTDNMCLVVREPVPITTGLVDIIFGSPAGGIPGTGGGSCTAPPNGPCSVANLQRYFGSAAPQAAMICNAESRGIINRVSQTDRMRNDPRHRAFSFGLFQINITQHSVAGLPCPSAFNGKNYAATVRDENLYRQCAAAAQTEQHNVAEAIATYNRTRWREWSTARQCGLARKSTPLIALENNP